MLANFGHGTAVIDVRGVGAAGAAVRRSAAASVADGIAQLAPLGYLWLTA
jgi:hypothetical protein